MNYEKELVKHKLFRWEAYLEQYALPTWKNLPDIGLYMDQVMILLGNYLNFLTPPSEKKALTPTTINNYVRMKVMPAPIKRKYYRRHIAYLVMILILKQSVSIAAVQHILPLGLSDEDLASVYTNFTVKLQEVAHYFTQQTRKAAQGILSPDEDVDTQVESLILENILTAGFSGLFAEKLLRLHQASLAEVLPHELPHETDP